MTTEAESSERMSGFYPSFELWPSFNIFEEVFHQGFMDLQYVRQDFSQLKSNYLFEVFQCLCEDLQLAIHELNRVFCSRFTTYSKNILSSGENHFDVTLCEYITIWLIDFEYITTECIKKKEDLQKLIYW